MIQNHQFLLYNHIVRELYRCRTYPELGQQFLPTLKLLVPFRYASILRRADDALPVQLTDPLCFPAEFAEAERSYLAFSDTDSTGWLSCCREPTVFRESDLLDDRQRLHSALYESCYQKFNVYDSMHCCIVHNEAPLGCLTLFRCRNDSPFTDEELFLFSSLGCHLNQHLHILLEQLSPRSSCPDYDFPSISSRYHLTGKETQLVQLLTRFHDNQEIAASLNIRESTLQKHYQNIFRKFDVTSRWEMMRLLSGSPGS